MAYNVCMDSNKANAVFIGDERRQNIYQGLAEYNTVLAGLYRTAIRSFKAPAYKGEERARIATIGNSMREVMNALASVIGNSSQTKHQDGAEKLVRKLPEKLAMFPEFNPKQDNKLIPLPREIALFISELSILASHEEGNIREDVAALLAEGSGKDHPAVKQWMDAREAFVGYTHYGRPPVESSTSNEEIERNIRVVEDLIERRLQSFFDSRHSVESLLSGINAQEED